ncbi:MAG: cupin domain-containing protein [Chitinophagales bacterium]
MIVFNSKNSNSGGAEGLVSYMLIGKNNAGVKAISIQYSEVQVGKEQPLHKHEPEQCYFIIEGTGLMTIDNEERQVFKGDAIYIPSNAVHGIKNNGEILMTYLTVNAPSFGLEYESSLWPKVP